MKMNYILDYKDKSVSHRRGAAVCSPRKYRDVFR